MLTLHNALFPPTPHLINLNADVCATYVIPMDDGAPTSSLAVTFA